MHQDNKPNSVWRDKAETLNKLIAGINTGTETFTLPDILNIQAIEFTYDKL